MKRCFSFLLLVLLSASCKGRLLSPEQPVLSQRSFLYCGLLNVRPSPYPPKSKAYLGAYLATTKIDVSVPSCKNSVFVQVAGIISGSPAEEAGLSADDIILSFNRAPTCLHHDDILTSFRKMIAQQEIGSTATMEVLRGDKKFSLSVKLAEVPTRLRPEAAHPDIGACGAEKSALEKTLEKKGALALFDSLREGLYQRTNLVLNPDVASDTRYDSLQLSETTYMMRHPLSSAEAAKELSRRLATAINERSWRMDDMVRKTAGLLDIDLSRAGKPSEVTFPELVSIMEKTKENVEKVLSALTPEEQALLRDKTLNPWKDSQWNTILDISMKVDRRELFSQFIPLLSFLTKENLSLLREDLIARFGRNKGPVLYEAETPIGKVIVGGLGPNIYREDAALILDLGGDDIYLNNAGGTRPGMPVALVIDWEGNDRYISEENFSQGAAVLGGGFLLDLSGDDMFISAEGSQGAGFFGLGFLYHGDGDAVYEARSFSQGIGQMGIGLLHNGAGNNLYHCLYAGQALGLFGGGGVLMDESGDDVYQLGGLVPDFRDPSKSFVSLGQGFGFGVRPEKGVRGVPGGIGMLIDESGDDIYSADYFAQGSAYYYGLGILNDLSGDDQYIAGRYAQGAGVHSAVGVLVNEGGNDSYHVSFGVGQGMGHDFGVGLLQDEGGDDRFRGGTLVQGAATSGGLGILLDPDGNDSYMFAGKGHGFAEESDCMGIVVAPPRSVGDKDFITLGIKRKTGD